MKFNHLNIPTHWQNYWTRFPEGHTILEALISWVSQVDEMVDNQNELNETVETYGNRLDDFIGKFDTNLQTTVSNTLEDWQNSGFLNMIINETLDTKYHEMDNRLSAQMAQTVKHGENESITKSMLSQEIKEDLAGGEIDFNLNTSEIEDGAVTKEKINKFLPSTSIIPSQSLDNTLQVGDGVSTPFERNKNNSFVLSNPINCNVGETWTIEYGDPTSVAYLYDSSDTPLMVIKTTTSNSDSPFKFTIPDIEGVHHFRVNIRKSKQTIEDYIVVKGDNINVAKKKKLEWLEVGKDNLDFTPHEFIDLFNFYDKNMLVKSETIAGVLQSGKGTDDDPFSRVGSSSFELSNPVACETGQTWSITSADPAYPVYFYNATDEPIDFIQVTPNKEPYTFTVPAINGLHHFRVNIRTSEIPIDNYVIVNSNRVDRLGGELDWLEVTRENLTFNIDGSGIDKRNKKIVTFGNSRTWYDGKKYGAGTKEAGVKVKGYQTYIREQLGMEVINVGVSGSRIDQTVDLIKGYSFTGDEYAVSLMHGTNNFNAVAGGEPGYSLGTVDHTKSGGYDVMSYAGGLQEFVEWVSINKPSLKMYLMTDAWCFKGGYGGMEREYSDIMREVAELYHYPFLDLYHMCGFNENNMEEYFVDTGSNLFHENTKGYERISEIIVPFIANH